MRSGQGTRVETSQMSSSVGVQRSPLIQDHFSSARTPDFKARAEAKKAWQARRSAPRSGLFLGLLAGGAIGCLSALAVMSVIPNDARTHAPGAATIERAATVQPVPAANQAAVTKAVTDGATVERREIRPTVSERSVTPAVPAATVPPVVPAAIPVVPASPPAATTRAATVPPGLARTDVSANAKPAVTPVAAPAAIPVAPALVAAEPPAPVLAQTDAADEKPKVAENKRKKKKQTVRHRQRSTPTQLARPDNFNFFFGGDRMARSF
jgi:hypothetical protein